MEKILIVDDENDIAELISDILEDEGYETKVANDGKSTIELVKNEDFSLILLDIMSDPNPLPLYLSIYVLFLLYTDSSDCAFVIDN